MKRIFVRGMSRSGGTLMATILDAHPDVAMCYETYEVLLAPAEGEADPASRFEAELARAVRDGAETIRDGQLRKFALRAGRAGVDVRTLAGILADHRAAGGTLDAFEGRMRVVEAVGHAKTRAENAAHWGTKIGANYDAIETLLPGSYYLFMLRDGRDIAASRKNVGQFKQSMADVARGWANQIRQFQRFAGGPGVHAYTVRYETLTAEPEAELRAIMSFLGLPWHEDIVQHHTQDLSLYRNPAGHLSREQVQQPIATTSVGRFAQDLTSEEIAAFEAGAGTLLDELGYPRATPATPGMPG
ncbi:MAG: sulfotransferase [Phycisphaerales bacterium]|nr:sulfotransferase [Phycisphaerae bacterium]NNF43090.1 sulfotransferase [Phycisphaerales bacterium]NNM27075.1 sulfotransferase [Phycisphaerales bacterium]